MGSKPGIPGKSQTVPNNVAPASERSSSSFETLTNDELEAHLGVYRYGAFDLTDAVRPSYDLQVVPRQGFRHDAYVDPKSSTKIPVIMASAIANDSLISLWISYNLSACVDVVLETSHHGSSDGHQDLYREHIDMRSCRVSSTTSKKCCSTMAVQDCGPESRQASRDPVRRAQDADHLRVAIKPVRGDPHPTRRSIPTRISSSSRRPSMSIRAATSTSGSLINSLSA